VSYVSVFKRGRSGVQNFRIEYPVAEIGIYDEVCDLKGCYVLKKMGSLAGFYPEVFKSCFCNDPGKGDI